MIRRLALFAVAICLAGAPAVRAQELSQAEKDKALQYLDSTKKGVEEATKGLSPAQWNFKPAPDRWSIAEVMEHIAATEDTLRGMVTEQVLKAPPAPDRDVKQIDEMVMTRIPDRSHKAQAPDALRPTNRFGSPEAALKHFEETRAATVALLKSTPDLRQHATDSPLGVKVDGSEWILFIAGHSERHTKQMLEVKADPNYPKQ